MIMITKELRIMVIAEAILPILLFRYKNNGFNKTYRIIAPKKAFKNSLNPYEISRARDNKRIKTIFFRCLTVKIVIIGFINF